MLLTFEKTFRSISPTTLSIYANTNIVFFYTIRDNDQACMTIFSIYNLATLLVKRNIPASASSLSSHASHFTPYHSSLTLDTVSHYPNWPSIDCFDQMITIQFLLPYKLHSSQALLFHLPMHNTCSFYPFPSISSIN